MTHPLDEKYIVFEYQEQDRETEGSAIALFRLKSRGLERVFSPALHFNPARLEMAKAPLIKLMKRRGINEVVSVFYDNNFFGIPSGFQSLDETQKEIVEQWYEYHSICFDSEEAYFLRQNGINIQFWDEERQRFLV